MSQEQETGEFATPAGSAAAPVSGEPVGRINLPEDAASSEPAEPGAPSNGDAAALPQQRDQMLQKVLFGVIAIGLMIVALVIMLQGVFEQKMLV